MSSASRLASLRKPDTASHARQLRRRMTPPEQALWYYVRGGRFGNRKIRRQVPLGAFVVDFLCEAARHVIEIDGDSHAGNEARDAERTQWLEAHGYRVLRFWNNDVMRNMEGVLRALEEALDGG
jgi:very-short-patch-repair endonuclease